LRGAVRAALPLISRLASKTEARRTWGEDDAEVRSGEMRPNAGILRPCAGKLRPCSGILRPYAGFSRLCSGILRPYYPQYLVR